jgi:uncharacterized protein YdeI (BOF family)
MSRASTAVLAAACLLVSLPAMAQFNTPGFGTTPSGSNTQGKSNDRMGGGGGGKGATGKTTTVKSSKSNTSDRMGGGGGKGSASKATTVKSSKSNTSD